MRFHVVRSCVGAAAVFAATLTGAAAEGRTITPAGLQADLRLAVETIERNHPELTHSVDPETLARAAEEIRRRLVRPMDRAEAWAALARLNPVLADGHLFIGLPDWRAESAEALTRGTRYFPFEVVIDAAGDLRIVTALGGGETPLAGTRIVRINGRDAGRVTRTLLARAHGDTPLFRSALVARRWWLFHRQLYGTPAAYDLVLDGAPRRTYRVPASGFLPAILRQEDSFEGLFRCEVTTGGGGLFVFGAAYWPDKQRFFDFARDCFGKLKSARAERLVIDVRTNGGGDDDMWKDGILRYIADRPYKHASRGVKRVVQPDPAKGEVAGQIVDGIVPADTVPPADEPLRFGGKVYVLIGSQTYSSAVLFSNVMQDYGFGTLVGVDGAVRSRQSGGTRSLVLPNTGLVLTYPRFVLTRPSGQAEPSLLTPDVPMADDLLRPRLLVDAVLSGK
jgi:Peptidase family S41